MAGAAALACSFLAHGADAPAAPAPLDLKAQLPLDPQIKVGKLANGLTYYIQKNGRPEKRLELRLVVKAGSVLEDEDQQGLAHFTEHMAFNGSTHFKRHELISYLQSVGVKFGADLNAYTSFNETVYMLPLPTDKREVVEQGFQVLEDWAHGLSFNDADIDSERGIVLEELRMGKGVDDRMSKVITPKVYNGSRYADRLPIGKEEILKHFKYDTLRRFYRDWYRPDLMAVIVVGDIDPADAQQLVERHFSGLVNPAHERKREYPVVPPIKASEALVVTDKEANHNGVSVRFPVEYKPHQNTLGEYRESLIEGVVMYLLGQRMYELTQQADPPFIQGGSGFQKPAPDYRNFNYGAVLGKGGVTPAIKAMVQENERARRFGFSAAELDRARLNTVHNFERFYHEREKTNSTVYVNEYVRNFLQGEAIPGIDNEYCYVQQLMPGITLDEVNALARREIPQDGAKLVVYTGTDRADTPPPKQDELLTLAEAAQKADVTARTEKTYTNKLMDPPRGGSILAESRDAKLGTTELTMSNGVKVILKPTDFNNDQILLAGQRFGGQSLAEDADILNARYASVIAEQMGIADYTPADLAKILAGKTAGASLGMGPLMETMDGHAGNDDIETMLQIVYLRVTQQRQDQAIFSSFLGKQRDMAQNSLSRPEAVFSDTLVSTLFNNHPRVARIARPGDFDHIQLNRLLEIYRARATSAAGFTFYLVGSFDVEKIKPLLATYLGGLPAAKIPAMYIDRGARPVRGVVKKEVHAGTEPKSTISIIFTGEAKFSTREQMKMEALTEIMNIKLIEVLREKMGAIYGGGMGGSLSKLPYENYSIGINLPCGPENVDKVIAATFAEIQKVKDHGPEAEDLEKVKASWAKNHRRNLRENGYWLGQLRGPELNGTQREDVLSFGDWYAGLTAADIQQAAQQYFDLQNYVQVVLYPAVAPATAAATAK